MSKLLTLTAICGVLSTPVMAQLDSSEPEEAFVYNEACVKIAWENPKTLAYGEGEPIKHDVAERLLPSLEALEKQFGIYHFLVPAECVMEETK